MFFCGNRGKTVWRQENGGSNRRNRCQISPVGSSTIMIKAQWGRIIHKVVCRARVRNLFLWGHWILRPFPLFWNNENNFWTISFGIENLRNYLTTVLKKNQKDSAAMCKLRGAMWGAENNMSCLPNLVSTKSYSQAAYVVVLDAARLWIFLLQSKYCIINKYKISRTAIVQVNNWGKNWKL